MCSESKELIIVLDFDGQYNQLIARRVREHNVYCEVLPYKTSAKELKRKNPKGLILTGGQGSVCDDNSPRADKEIFEMGIPVLGIGYGCHFMCYALNGTIEKASDKSDLKSEETVCKLDVNSPLFSGLKSDISVWMNHNDNVKVLPDGFKSTATSDKCKNAAVINENKKLFGLQFHPEVSETAFGSEIVGNFLINICGCKRDWTMRDYAEQKIMEIKKQIGDGKVLLALSGGVDSSVCCALLGKALGSKLSCIFVDTGLMRKNEGDEVETVFKDKGVNFIRVDAADRFLGKLAGVDDPEQKRKIIGEEFIRVFEEEAKKLGETDFFAQGTIYTDVIESGHDGAKIVKSHHNVGGLPEKIGFKEIVEPLKPLFKNEVRELGRELGLPKSLVDRQIFPGPGLAIRVIGEVTHKKLEMLREADYIFREEIEAAGLAQSLTMYFAILTDMRSVGVKDGGRTYDYTCALRAITSTDIVTAEFAKIPYDVLERVSVRIVNEVEGINRICYDVTSKPPATIEWE